MTVISLGRSIGRVRARGDDVEKKVKAASERVDRSVLSNTIATSRYERAVVELLRDRERLAAAGR